MEDDLPMRNIMRPQEFYDDLDDGIRFAVKILHAYGIETAQSCEGGKGHSYDRPTVDLSKSSSSDARGFAAFHALVQYNLPVMEIAYVWVIDRANPCDSFWRITFSKPMYKFAEREPIFIRYYQWNRKAGV